MAIPMPSQGGPLITTNRYDINENRLFSKRNFDNFIKKMTIEAQVGEGGSLLGEEVVGHMVNEHLAEQLGEVYRRDRHIILKVEECDSRIRIYVSLFL